MRTPHSRNVAKCATEELTAIQSEGLPVGWKYWTDSALWPKGWGWLSTPLRRILVTAGAASLGAPFWFDVIARVSPLRNGGTKPGVHDGRELRVRSSLSRGSRPGRPCTP